jgi:hypothetical protein
VDSWYATQPLMAMIENLGNIFYFYFTKKLLVDDTKKA